MREPNAMCSFNFGCLPFLTQRRTDGHAHLILRFLQSFNISAL